MHTSRGDIGALERLDVFLALAVAVLEISDVFLFNSHNRRDALVVALVFAAAVPLIGWRRWPFVTLQLTAGATIALAALHAAHIGLGPIAGTYAVACWDKRPSRWVAAGSLLVGVWLVPLLTRDASSIPTNAALFGAAWILGSLMRDRRITNQALQVRTVELAREREEKAALATEMERARIARELHDVLTHSLSVMVIQAQAAQAAGSDRHQVTTALERIEAVGKESLTELRGLLRQLRPAAEAPARYPQPGLDHLSELLADVRAAGLEVLLTQEGKACAIPAGIDLSAYRIVQEALTNTLRHTEGACATVRLRYLPNELFLEVLDNGRAPAGRSRADGHGLAGMRERARLAGGSLIIEGLPEGGFRVAARLPLSTG